MHVPDVTYQVHIEARGPHWISWITRRDETKPHQSVVIVAANAEEAKARAHAWAGQARHT